MPLILLEFIGKNSDDKLSYKDSDKKYMSLRLQQINKDYLPIFDENGIETGEYSNSVTKTVAWYENGSPQFGPCSDSDFRNPWEKEWRR